jgi:hypothetical protein
VVLDHSLLGSCPSPPSFLSCHGSLSVVRSLHDFVSGGSQSEFFNPRKVLVHTAPCHCGAPFSLFSLGTRDLSLSSTLRWPVHCTGTGMRDRRRPREHVTIVIFLDGPSSTMVWISGQVAPRQIEARSAVHLTSITLNQASSCCLKKNQGSTGTGILNFLCPVPVGRLSHDSDPSTPGLPVPDLVPVPGIRHKGQAQTPAEVLKSWNFFITRYF